MAASDDRVPPSKLPRVTLALSLTSSSSLLLLILFLWTRQREEWVILVALALSAQLATKLVLVIVVPALLVWTGRSTNLNEQQKSSNNLVMSLLTRAANIG